MITVFNRKELIISSIDSNIISLKIDPESITADTSPLCGAEEILEGEYKRLNLTDTQLEEARQRLNVPSDIDWYAGARWLVYVGVYADGKFLAGASFDPLNMEMCTDIYTYSGI